MEGNIMNNSLAEFWEHCIVQNNEETMASKMLSDCRWLCRR